MQNRPAPAALRATPALAIIGGGIRLLSRVSRSASSRLAFELFRTPRRFRIPERERALLSGATAFDIRLSSATAIKAWRWGTGPAIILMHGWEGRGSQMAAFAQPLVELGHSVITFDAPGHGASPGRTSSLPHFAWALRGVADVAGPVAAIIGHSLGCAAATLAIRDGLKAGRVVFVAPPLNPSDYTRQFGEIFGLGDEVIEGLRSRVEERFLRRWTDYSLATTAPAMSTPLLIIHDREDVETPWSGGSRLAELWPGAKLMTTDGFGHRRVLREQPVIDAVREFLAPV